jgi:uncharacterized YigZ family protein
MNDEYHTVLKYAVREITVKKSRFIASVKPVSNENDAAEFIDKIKKEHWKARHNAFAFSIGNRKMVQRYSDDGEPQGTAGIPILEAIKKITVTDLVVVVTRYFGGILLGASGLARAYNSAAVSGIRSSEIVSKLLCTVINITVKYPLFGTLNNMLTSEGFFIGKILYRDEVTIQVYVPYNKRQMFLNSVQKVTNAKACINAGESSYILMDSSGRIVNI